MAIGRQDYEDRKQAKINRANELAEKASAESSQRSDAASHIADRIPMGQPILVGHHSEAHARRDQEKIWNNMEKSMEAAKKADYYSDKAAATEGNTAISSDDPEAVWKLEQKLEKLLEEQAFMKKVNAFYRKNKTCKGLAGLEDEAAQTLDNSMKNAYSWETAPFAPYVLTSVNAKIKAVRERIARFERIDTMPHEVIDFDGGKIISNSEINRVQIVFDERQCTDTIKNLKRYGFKWSPSEKAWQRLRTPSALEAAKYLSRLAYVKIG